MHRLLLASIILSFAAFADDAVEPIKTKLYLTSAAINVLDDLVPLLPERDNATTDCYIVTAGNLDGNPHWIADEIGAIRGTARAVEAIDLAQLRKDTLEAAFDRCAVIWVGGGNTFYLLQEVRRSGFDELAARKLAAGTPYVGTSAGSIILSPNIEAVKFADDATQAPNLGAFDGLGLFPLVPFAHFDHSEFKDVYQKILAYALENDVGFVTLKEKEFIAVDGDSWRIINVK